MLEYEHRHGTTMELKAVTAYRRIEQWTPLILKRLKKHQSGRYQHTHILISKNA